MKIDHTLKALYTKNPHYWLAIQRNVQTHPKLSSEQIQFINILKEVNTKVNKMSHYLKIGILARSFSDDTLYILHREIRSLLKRGKRQEEIVNTYLYPYMKKNLNNKTQRKSI